MISLIEISGRVPSPSEFGELNRVRQQLKTDKSKKTSNDIVNHNAQPAMHLPVQPADGPGFPDIKEAEQGEPKDDPHPAFRGRNHGDPIAYKFVPDYTRVIMYAKVFGSSVTEPDAKDNADQQYQQVVPERQILESQEKRNGGQGAECAGRFWSKTAAKAKGEKMDWVLPDRGRLSHGFLYLLKVLVGPGCQYLA